MTMQSIFTLISLAFISLCAELEGTKVANKTFIPTNDWQEIAEGQSIPAGLHVRVNLTSGKKEAKLLEEQQVNNQNLINGEEFKAIEHVSDKSKLQREYKSYDELKKTYNEMRKSFRSDAEIIVQLIDQYHNLSKLDLRNDKKLKDQLQILENLNYLLHQIDNAHIFIDKGGLDDILLPIVVNETNVALRVPAMRVLGALAQNNPSAQIKVYEKNFGSHLAQIISKTSHTEELSTAIYAFGSLLRKFPYAQIRIMETSGMQALIGVLIKKGCELRTKVKVLTLISDLVVEKRLIMESLLKTPNEQTELMYKQLQYEIWLPRHDYCEALTITVTDVDFSYLLEQPDQIELISVAIDTTKEYCETFWKQNAQLRHVLLTLKNRLSADTTDEYRLEVAVLIEKLYNHIFATKKNRGHDEF